MRTVTLATGCLAALSLPLAAGCARVAPAEPREPPAERYRITAAPPPRSEAVGPAPRPAPSLAARILFFLPDRTLDLLDTVSFGVGIGAGFDVHQQATCSLHLPTLGTYRSFNFLNWYHKRNLCMCTREETEFGLLFLSVYRSEFFGAGTGWNEGSAGSGLKDYAQIGLASADHPIHKEKFRDPWAIGAHYGPLLLSPRLELEIHPTEIVDFLLGTLTFGAVDLLGDDLATARAGP
jgi:hypothetical protein